MINQSLSPTINRVHFPGLNTLRCYAALAVIVSHIDQNIEPRPFLSILLKHLLIDADSAVNLFFVLSGFLITYLLLHESTSTGEVAVGKFYLRRALRIWPLYYLIAIIGLLIFPLIFGSEYSLHMFYPEYPIMTAPISVKLILVFCLLPNFASISAPMEHLWSIGVEEQFYALWPWVIRKKLDIVRVCIGVLIIKFIVAGVIPFLPINGMMNIFGELRFECMAVGALGAYVYYEKFPFLKWMYHPGVQLLALGLCVYMAGRQMQVNPFVATGMSVAFIVVILNVATNPRPLIKLKHPFLERLGQISYGLYLYHFPILFVFLRITPHFTLFGKPFYPTGVLIGTIASTWLIAEISYRWFEKPFLSLKEKFATV